MYSCGVWPGSTSAHCCCNDAWSRAASQARALQRYDSFCSGRKNCLSRPVTKSSTACIDIHKSTASHRASFREHLMNMCNHGALSLMSSRRMLCCTRSAGLRDQIINRKLRQNGCSAVPCPAPFAQHRHAFLPQTACCQRSAPLDTRDNTRSSSHSYAKAMKVSAKASVLHFWRVATQLEALHTGGSRCHEAHYVMFARKLAQRL